MHPNIHAYITKQAPPQQAKLREIHSLISDLFPAATEGMSYGVPAFKLNGQTIMFAAFKKHLGLYPDPTTIEAFKAELQDYQTSKGAIQFDLEKPLPITLIKKIVEYKFK